MGFTYVRIFKAAGQHNRRISHSASDMGTATLSNQTQIALTVFIMLVVFILCWTPYFVYVIYITANHRQDEISRDLALAAYWCAFMNSSLNPFIYGIRNPSFRAEFKNIISSLIATLSGWLRLASSASSTTSFSVAQTNGSEASVDVAKTPSLLRNNATQGNSYYSNESYKDDECFHGDGISEANQLDLQNKSINVNLDNNVNLTLDNSP